MTINLNNSLFFAGGKVVKGGVTDNEPGLRFTKQEDGWVVNLMFKINDEESKDVMNVFKDFKSTEQFEEAYPNQVYFEAFDNDGKPVDILMTDILLNVFNAHKTQEGGFITVTMYPASGTGKTQNSKTQNSNTKTKAL